jgi:hypothetical protein
MQSLSCYGTDDVAYFSAATAPSAFADDITVILLCMCFLIVMYGAARENGTLYSPILRWLLFRMCSQQVGVV